MGVGWRGGYRSVFGLGMEAEFLGDFFCHSRWKKGSSKDKGCWQGWGISS